MTTKKPSTRKAVSKRPTSVKALPGTSNLYAKPLAATRTGAIYNAFSYPTKISAESVALFIATHTRPGETVLDGYAGSGSTGLAAKLCDAPTSRMKQMANQLGLHPEWGPRNAVLYEIGSLGSFISRIMCSPPEPSRFLTAATQMVEKVESEISQLYKTKGPDGSPGYIRHIVWTDFIACKICKAEASYYDLAVHLNPLKMGRVGTCPKCGTDIHTDIESRVLEEQYDTLLKKMVLVRKKRPAVIYGVSGKSKWKRIANAADWVDYERFQVSELAAWVPIEAMRWGELHRSGYHAGISHVHQFYTARNLIAFSRFWDYAQKSESEISDALKLLVLSYNSSHSTLMTRVVAKRNQKDFVITGSQPGVLYISSLPVEKNLIFGIKRKIKTFEEAFSSIYPSQSHVVVHNASSTELGIETHSIDYVFTDPPFGANIPYSEVNQLNEAWLGSYTNTFNEAIISPSQSKTSVEYCSLITKTFTELARVLKPGRQLTIVFHSAHVEVWRAFVSAFQQAELEVVLSGILDKVQASFKQTISDLAVQGDPLILLRKKGQKRQIFKGVVDPSANDVKGKGNTQQVTHKRLYTLYINDCLMNDTPITLGSSQFAKRLKEVGS